MAKLATARVLKTRTARFPGSSPGGAIRLLKGSGVVV